MILLMMLTANIAGAQQSWTPVNIGGNDYKLFIKYYWISTFMPHDSNNNSSEYGEKLLDNNKNTQWKVINNSGEWETGSITFYVKDPSKVMLVQPKGYILTTGSDVSTYNNRNPKSWNLYAKADKNADWTLIDSRDGSVTPADALPTTDRTDKVYMLDNNDLYCYFKLEITDLCGSEGSNWAMELSELQIYGNIVEPTNAVYQTYDDGGTTVYRPCFVSGLSPVYKYNDGNAVNVTYTIRWDDSYMSHNYDYTSAITKAGEPVATVAEAGDYTLTLTGIGNYAGTFNHSFTVKTLSGAGSELEPYLINNTEDWKLFGNYLDAGYTFNGEYVKLVNNITVSTMIGSSANKFQGTFDGNGKTLTLNFYPDSSTAIYAPFRYIDGATIHHLTVDGYINNNGTRNAGLVGYAYGDNTIDNCFVTAIIKCIYGSYSQNQDNAGFISMIQTGNTHISNCAFLGKLLGMNSGTGNSRDNAGFVGEIVAEADTVYYTDCLFAPKSITLGTSGSYTFNRGGKNVLTRAYYTQNFGSSQGYKAFTEPQTSLCINKTLIDGNSYWIVGKSTIDVDAEYSYTGSEITVTPVVTIQGEVLTNNVDYTYSISPSPVQNLGVYTVTVTGIGNCAGTKTQTFRVVNILNGSGTYEDPYQITSSEDWNKFAANVTGGVTYNSEYIKLMNDITVTTMAAQTNYFRGIFLGNNKTMTLNLVGTSDRCAPFKQVSGCTIRDLNVTGTITTSGDYAASLIGEAYYYYGMTDYITNCVSTVTIRCTGTSKNYTAGFVGQSYQSTIRFTNCAFNGKLLSDNANNRCNGFVGSSGDNVYVTDCFFNPSEVTFNVTSARTFSPGTTTVLRSYYVMPFGELQGKQVYTSVPDAMVYGVLTAADGNDYYLPVDITDLAPTYAYTGSEITVTPTVSFNGTNLTQGVDYTVSFSPASLVALGEYTATITGIGSYSGSTTRTFVIMEGVTLDGGYVFVEGTDAEGTYYTIANESDLERLADYVNSGHNADNQRFKMTADITMTNPHTSIGYMYTGENVKRPFSGVFDGDNHVINNLVVNQPKRYYAGLFGYVTYKNNDVVIKNVTLSGCNIVGGSYTGGIAGYTDGYAAAKRVSIQNCKLIGGTIGTEYGYSYFGGIVGNLYRYTDLNNCVVNGTVINNTHGGFYIGGIAGRSSYSSNTITNCECVANIIGNGSYYGGILGYLEGIQTLTNNFYKGSVQANASYRGAIVGNSTSSSAVTNNYYASSCNVKGINSADQAGKADPVYTISAGENISSLTSEDHCYTSVITGTKYYKAGTPSITLTPNVPAGYVFVRYMVNDGEISNPTTVDGAHTVTITNKDIVVSAVISKDNAVNISGADIAAIPEKRWKNAPVTPALTVTINATTLVEGTDYDVLFENNINIGEATVTLIGKDNYQGTTSTTFNIADFHLLDPTTTNSSTNPYLVETEEDLQALASLVNTNGRLNGFYQQVGNITLTEEHTAIGTLTYKFAGTYDGHNDTIIGLTINKPETAYQGLFGYMDSGKIKYVNVKDCDVLGYNYTGALVGRMTNSSDVSYCSASGTVHTDNTLLVQYIGGLVGYNDGGQSGYPYIRYSINRANVSGSKYVGGITGYNFYSKARTQYCKTFGTVSGEEYVGNVMGYTYSTNSDVYYNYYFASNATIYGIGEQGSSVGADKFGAAEMAFTVTTGANTNIESIPNAAFTLDETNYYACGANGLAVVLSYDTPLGAFFNEYAVNSGSISYPAIIDGSHTITDVRDNLVITGSHTNQCDINNINVTVSLGTYPYTGNVINVTPLVKYLDNVLVADTDYTFAISPSTVQAIGEYTMTITGMGNFVGTRNETFHVADATLIHNADDWDAFTASVNDGTGSNGYYKLADDFDNSTPVTTMAGTTEHPFAGLFDGNGKTLVVNINQSSVTGVAPFKEIADATIKNLTVNGTVAGRGEVAGLVGYTRSGVNYIENCVINTNISNNTNNVVIGGVVANGLRAALNITNTVYTGTVTPYNIGCYVGGLLGWSEGSTLNVTNCLVTGYYSGSCYHFHPIAIKAPNAAMSFTDNGAFFTHNKSSQLSANNIVMPGRQVYTSAAQNALSKKETIFNETQYYSRLANTIGNVEAYYEYTGEVFNVTPTFTYGEDLLTEGEANDYTCTIDPNPVQAIATYTLTITGCNDYVGTKTMTFKVDVEQLTGGGTSNNPYVIATDADWLIFVRRINVAHDTYYNKYISLTNDITVSTMAGNEECGFAGNFNGNSHTITLAFTNHSYTLEPGENEGAQGIALFNYVGKGCYIRNLHVDGTIVTANKFAAGFIAYISPGTSSSAKTVSIYDCVSSVSITSTVEGDATSAGFVGCSKAYVNVTLLRCVFNGTFISNTAQNFSGMVGWQQANGKTIINNCLVNADVTGLTTPEGGHYTFCRSESSSAYSTSNPVYYVTAIGTEQGTRIYTEANVPATPLYGQITGLDGNHYYASASVSGISNSYSYTGNVIDITPSITISNQSVSYVAGTDYEITYTLNGDPVAQMQDLGNYVVTVSGKADGKCKGSYSKNTNVYGAKPTGLMCTDYSLTSGTLTWTDAVATNWTVEISTNTSFNPIYDSKDVNTTSATFTELIPETTYYARVKAVYGEITSAWSDLGRFDATNAIVIGYNSNGSLSYLPTNHRYYYSMTQQIYTAAELGGSGTVLNVDFFKISGPNSTRNLNIYMVNTEKAVFESKTDWIVVSDSDKVFSGSVAFNGTNKWISVVLDTPFEYDSNKNLAIIVDDNTGTMASNPVYSWTHSAGANRCLYMYDQSTNVDPTDPSTLNVNYKYVTGNMNTVRIRMGKAFVENTAWNDPTNWEPNGLPTGSDYISIVHDVTVPDGCTAYANCISFGEGTITVASGGTLILTEGAVNGNATNLIVEDGGQVVVNRAGTYATINHTIADPAKDGAGNWYTIASPVNNVTTSTGTNIIQVPATNYDFYYYDEAASMWRNHKQTAITNMTNGKGYLYWNGTGTDLTYTGELNSSAVVINVTKTGDGDYSGWNLIGNPFTHNIYKGVGGAIDDARLTEGYYTMTDNATWSAKIGYETPIVHGQGVLVRATETFDLTIANSTTPATGARSSQEYLEFSVADRFFEDVAYALFDEGIGLDKIDHRNDQAPMLYIPQNGKNYAIATMSEGTETFNLNFKSKTTSRYLLSYKAKGDFDYLHVIDRMTGADVDMLMEEDYTFIGSPSDNENRFIVKLRYNANGLGNGNNFAYQSDDEIIINGEGELQVFDVLGRFVMSHNINGSHRFSTGEFNSGVYIFRLVGNEIKTQKIVVK